MNTEQTLNTVTNKKGYKYINTYLILNELHYAGSLDINTDKCFEAVSEL